MNQNDDYETRADAEFDRIKEERPDRCQCDMCLFIDQLGELHDLSGMQEHRSNYDRISSEPFALLETLFGPIEFIPDPIVPEGTYIYSDFSERNIIPMTHENPASIVPGSMHVNRAGDKVFIECVRLQSPWTDPRKDPVHGVCEKDRNLRSYQLSGQYFESKQSELDLIREYKEPKTHTGYLIIWKSGDTAMTPSVEMAHESGKLHSAQGRNPYRIIKLTGTEDDEIVSSSDFRFNPLAHEQCK